MSDSVIILAGFEVVGAFSMGRAKEWKASVFRAILNLVSMDVLLDYGRMDG